MQRLHFVPDIRQAHASELPHAMAIDDDASTLFADMGLSMAHLVPDHPFVQAEYRRWQAAVGEGSLYFACSPQGEPIGFVALGTIDGDAYVVQLAVLRRWMKRGVGSALLEHAKRWGQHYPALWLTTYSHVPWNRAWYQARGFRVVEEDLCGSGIKAMLAEERAVLPEPGQRIAMRVE